MPAPWSPGDEITAARLNAMIGGADNFECTYNTDGSLATIFDSDQGVTYTFAYNDDDTIDTVTDGTSTWTFSYDADGNIDEVVKTP